MTPIKMQHFALLVQKYTKLELYRRQNLNQHLKCKVSETGKKLVRKIVVLTSTKSLSVTKKQLIDMSWHRQWVMRERCCRLSTKKKESKAEESSKSLVLSSNLTRQSFPMRGNWSEKSGSEFNANFNQLLLLRCEGDPEMAKWLERKHFRYTSPVVQNEMLEVLALGIMREITANIQTAGICTIMADETADISNTEQLAVCFRWIDKNMEAHEDFVGLPPLSRRTADSIVQVLKDVLLRMNLDLNDSRGQCYDGAATMSGKASGVATQFKLENEKMLYSHCYGHALNLAIKDACDKVECLKEAFDSIREICKLVKKSPQRDTKLSEIRSATQNQEKSIDAFCPTR